MIELLPPILGRLNQGVIFSCAAAERYPGERAYGLVITARCDIEQDKFPVLNYVPVVPLSSWLRVDGYDILSSRAENDVESRINNLLEAAELPSSLLLGQSPRAISDAVFADPAAVSKVKKGAAKFASAVTMHEALKGAQRLNPESHRYLHHAFPGLKKTMVKELVKGTLTGHYYVPRVHHDEGASGYVALLREVTHLPRSLAIALGKGLDDGDHQIGLNPNWREHLCFDHDRFAMPTGELPSPQVEHLLQVFSSLFGRIGLADYKDEYLEQVCATPPDLGILE